MAQVDFNWFFIVALKIERNSKKTPCTKIVTQSLVMMMMAAVVSLVVDDERSVLEMDTESHHTRWHLGDHIIISSSSK